jgi:hypothetical protein
MEVFAKNAVCNLGAADWHGREAIRQDLDVLIDTLDRQSRNDADTRDRHVHLKDRQITL